MLNDVEIWPVRTNAAFLFNALTQPEFEAAQIDTGIITTPSELVRWGDQYRQGDLIQEDNLAGAVEENDGSGDYYAAGINIQPDGDLAHSGRMGGFISVFTVSADRQTVIAVACNGHLMNRTPINEALWDIWEPSDHPVE